MTVPAVARADQLLQDYGIKEVAEYGGVTRFHEDDRGIFYWGAFQWNDPQYDSDYAIVGILGFMKPQSDDGTLIFGTEFDGELHGFQQPLFNLAESEIEYFNAVLLPPLREIAPHVDESTGIQMRGYAHGLHFGDSEIFRESRANHRIMPEEPIFGLGWRRNDQGRYVPHYEVTGDAGIGVADWPFEDGTRKFWSTVASARNDRAEQDAMTSASGAVAAQFEDDGEGLDELGDAIDAIFAAAMRDPEPENVPEQPLTDLNNPLSLAIRAQTCLGAYREPSSEGTTVEIEDRERKEREWKQADSLARWWSVIHGYSLMTLRVGSTWAWRSEHFVEADRVCTQDLQLVARDLPRVVAEVYGPNSRDARSDIVRQQAVAISENDLSADAAGWCLAATSALRVIYETEQRLIQELVQEPEQEGFLQYFDPLNTRSNLARWQEQIEQLQDRERVQIEADPNLAAGMSVAFEVVNSYDRYEFGQVNLLSNTASEEENQFILQAFREQEYEICSMAIDEVAPVE